MPRIDVIQNSFSAGEFGPSLYGRSDIAQYANACKTVENFFPRSYGPAISMPGTTYIATASNGTLRTRLIKFVFNRTDAYVIEFGRKYFRFYTNGGVVVTTGTTPFTLTHIYDETEVADVQFTQLNDVVWMTHPNHPPQKLIRSAAASWSIADAPIIGGPFLDDNTPILSSANISSSSITITPSATSGTINITVSPTNAGLFTLSTSTLGHQGAYWMIGGLAQTNSTTGLQEIGYVRITSVVNSYTATAVVIKNLKAATAQAVWAEGAFSAVRGYPSRVRFHERRLFYARTSFEPAKEWGSVIFDYDNYALNTESDDDGLNLPLASNESNDIQWLASAKRLFAGTFGGIFITSSGADAVLTPNNASASENVGIGASSIVPRKIGNLLYYLDRFGKKLLELFYEFATDTFKTDDKTILSPHILGDGVIDMDVQQNPENVIYCVLTSGTLATMTREVIQQVTGWARQTTSGTYTSIAIIPSQSNNYEDVYVLVTRYVNGSAVQYVELFDGFTPPTRQDLCNYLHASLRYNAYNTTSTSTLTISLSATGSTESTIDVTASGAIFATTDVGKRIRCIDALGNTMGEGLIVSRTSSTVVNVSITNTFSSLSYAVNRWGVSVTTISGLSHLEAKTVNVLADGGTDRPAKTVSSGAITLSNDAFVVNCGLSYNQILELLPKENGSARGTSRGKLQKINEVSFLLNRSHKGFQVGPDSSHLDQVGKRDPSTLLGTPELLFTGTFPNDSSGAPHTMDSDWKYGATIYIKNADPLPIEFLGVILSLETSDK